MPESIKISYTWSRDNFQKLFDSSYRYQFNHSMKRYIGWLFVAILQLGVVAALTRKSFELLLFATIMLLYWYYGKKIIARKRAAKVFENSSFKDKTIQIEVDEKGFDIKSDEGESHWSWSEVDEVSALEDDVMIYRHPNFHYIPSSGFRSLEDKSHFKSLAKKNQKLKG